MKSIRKEIVFLAKFFLIYALLQALIQFSPLYPLEKFIAGIEANAAGLESSGNAIRTINGDFAINASCTGLVSAGVLAAIIFSLRKPGLKTKLLLLAAGAIALFLLNLARVYVVVLVAVNYGTGAAEFAHVTSWFATAAFILAAWILGIKKIAGIRDFSGLI